MNLPPAAPSIDYVIEEKDGLRVLVPLGTWTAEMSDVIEAGGADGIILNYARGFRDPNLQFIRPWPIKSLVILSRTVTNLEPVYRVSDTLERLGLTTSPSAEIDLGRFPNLTSLFSESWSQIRASVIQARGLRSLHLYGYTETDMVELSGLALSELSLKQAPRLDSLSGLQGMRELRTLMLAGCPRLSDTQPIHGHALTTLSLQSCKSVNSLDVVANVPTMERLSANDCGPVSSLSPILATPNLRRLHLWGSTDIVDGDLSPILTCIHLNDLRMANRAHYTPSLHQVKSTLGL